MWSWEGGRSLDSTPIYISCNANDARCMLDEAYMSESPIHLSCTLSLEERRTLDAVMKIRELLMKTTKLLTLSLKGYSGSMLRVGEALNCNNSLRVLELCWMDHVMPQEITAICRALHHNRSIHTLKLERITSFLPVQLPSICPSHIGEALSLSDTLRVVKLISIEIGNGGLASIGKALHRNKSLEVLYIREWSLDCEGILSVARGLEYNNSLRVLRIRGRIGDDGARYISTALQRNSSLEVLSIGSQIGDDGAKCIGTALANNSSLRVLDISNNQFGDESAIFIRRAWEDNRTLRYLVMKNTHVSKRVRKHIEALCCFPLLLRSKKLPSALWKQVVCYMPKSIKHCSSSRNTLLDFLQRMGEVCRIYINYRFITVVVFVIVAIICMYY